MDVSDCSALKRMVIDYGDLRQRIELRVKNTDDYDWAELVLAYWLNIASGLKRLFSWAFWWQPT